MAETFTTKAVAQLARKTAAEAKKARSRVSRDNSVFLENAIKILEKAANDLEEANVTCPQPAMDIPLE